MNVDLKNATKYYACPVCHGMMCRICQASHPGMTCYQYLKHTNTDVTDALALELDWVCETCTFINVNAKDNNMLCDSCGQRSKYADRDNDDDDTDDGSFDDFDDTVVFNDDLDEVVVSKTQYDQLLELEDLDLIPNTERFDCVICFADCDEGTGVKLRECLHEFCKLCLSEQIRNSLGATVACPFSDDNYSCECALQDREIRGLVPIEVFEQYLMRSFREAQGKLADGFQCKTPNCEGFWCHDEFITSYRCLLCNHLNCHQCRVSLNCFFLYYIFPFYSRTISVGPFCWSEHFIRQFCQLF